MERHLYIVVVVDVGCENVSEIVCTYLCYIYVPEGK